VIVSSTNDVVPVLPQHRFDEAGLARFMAEHIEGFSPPLRVAQFQGGMSNPTFRLTDGRGLHFVLRKNLPGACYPRLMQLTASTG
jgi:aminoglycoside phosphotransferase (APT) family kinase protein